MRYNVLGLLILPLLLSHCELLQQAAQVAATTQVPSMPTVAYQDAVLVQAPSKSMMAAYYCPQVVPDVLLPGSAAVACAAAFGSPPSVAQMAVAFDLHFSVNNPNNFPIPVAQLLTAATVFPDKSQTALGAACVVFCAADQPGCTGQPGPGDCVSKASDIKSLSDFQNASTNFLVASGVTLLQGGTPSFTMPQVVQASQLTVTARFSFGPTVLLGVLQQLANQAVDKFKTGQQVEFVIPYRLLGTVWLDVGSLGRVQVAFGPVDGTWTLPATALQP